MWCNELLSGLRLEEERPSLPSSVHQRNKPTNIGTQEEAMVKESDPAPFFGAVIMSTTELR